MKREIAQVITFQRDQLYDEIWSVPILQLAPQSDFCADLPVRDCQ